jgi:5-(hydroxymethyl)furfural/furfural oxidase
VLDTYPVSYYNDAHMWSGLKVHWRRRDNSPAVAFSQGRLIGGGSSVMGMVALRGTPDDYAEWEAQGAAGWGWDGVLPFFRKLEHDMDFAGDLHGDAGPVPIRRTPAAAWPPLSRVLREFAQERQIPLIADMNGDFRDGYAAVPMSNWPDKRASAAICYLDAAVRARSNLTLVNRATVTQLLLEGRRAVGVQADVAGQDTRFLGREVVVCAGAIHSPALLLRAGIGPAGDLRALGIEVRADLPGVGQNLSNHAIMFVALHLHPEGRQATSLRPHPTTLFRFSSGVPGCPPSDMYINVQSKTSWSALGHQIANLAPVLWKPMARGQVVLTSADHRQEPLVEFNFVGHELDLARFKVALRRTVEMLMYYKVSKLCGVTFPVKFTDRLRLLNRYTTANAAKSMAIAKLIDLIPTLGPRIFATLADRRVDLAMLVHDDAALAEHIRENVGGQFHVVGTCRMGAAHDRQAVVNPVGRVHGIAGLRVADASIMPTVTRGNTNIPTIMLAEKISAAMGEGFSRG